MADIGLLFKQIDEGLSRRANQSLRQSDSNLTFSQMSVLILLEEQGGDAGMSLREIEHHLGMSQPTVTGLIKRLVEKGYATSSVDEQDRRQRCVRLTPAGWRSVDRSAESRAEAECTILKGFNAKERAQLEGYLRRVLENVK